MHPRNLGVASLAALGLLALLALVLPAAWAAPPATGDWVVTSSEGYADQVIVVEGNVFVRSPAVLTLTNVTLEINSTAGARRGLVVESGAALVTRDSDMSAATTADRTVIRPLGLAERITLVASPGSTVDFQQTTFWGIGYTQSPVNASGLYLASSSTFLQNVTVFSSFFGIVFVGVTGQLENVEVHNNTYNGLEVDATSNLTIRGLRVADNGGTGVHVAGGRVNITTASLLHNDVGLGVKFGGRAQVTFFDASANANNFVVLNAAVLVLSDGRVQNSSTAGLDARIDSTVSATSVVFTDNALAVYLAAGSNLTASAGEIARGTRGIQLRTGAYASLSDLAIRSVGGDAIDLDNASADLFRCTVDGNAFGGVVTSGTAFSFIDSTLSNSTVAGLTFTSTSGIYIHNPTLVANKGRALSLVASPNALMDATSMARIVGSSVDVGQLLVSGTLHVENATLHAVAARLWNVTGTLDLLNASIVGDVAGASLSLGGGSTARVRGLALAGFGLRVNAAAGSDFDGLNATGASEVAVENGTYNWRNVTQSGTGRLRVGLGNLEVRGGSVEDLQADDGGRLDLIDVTADLSTGVVVGSGLLLAWWTTEVDTLWQPAVPAPSQWFNLTDATSAAVASGSTNASGRAALGPVLAQTASAAGPWSSNPHRLVAGSGSWSVAAFFNITSAGPLVITLKDTTPPTLSITWPANGSRVNGNPVVIAALADDGESGLLDLEWSYDNASFTPEVLTNPITVSVPAPFETAYRIFVRVHDKAGNPAVASVTYRVDRTPPNIALAQPSNNSALRGPTVRFVGATEAGANLTIAGTPVPLDSGGNFDVNLTFADGNYSVPLYAVDGAGNFATGTLLLLVDSVPPAVVVESPGNGSLVAGQTALLQGRVEPGASLFLGSTAQFVAGNGSFTVEVDLLVEGPQSYLLRAVDLAGNSNETTWTLVRDTRPPSISVAELQGTGPFTVNSTRPQFHVTTNEFATIEATWSPSNVSDAAAGTQLVFSPATTQGPATLRVVATDQSGNQRSVNYTIEVDLTPPTLVLDARAEGGAVNRTPWDLLVTAEVGALVTINGAPVPATTPGAATFARAINLTSGPNTFVIVAVDAAGNRASRTVTIVLDVLPPALLIIGPEDGVTTGDRQIVVSGTTEPGANLTVAGAPVTVGPTGEWSAVVQLLTGTNHIVIVASDAAGNTATATRAVTRSGAGSSITGIPFLDQNGWFLLILVVGLLIAAMVISGNRAKRRALGEKSASIEREIDGAHAMRNDFDALANFTPRAVGDPEFVSSEEFRHQGATQERDGSPPSQPKRPGNAP